MKVLAPGDFLQRYQIVRMAGEGAMGLVYEGVDPTVGRRVALEVLRPDLGPDYSPELRERFRREAGAAANRSGAATLLDYGESAEGLLYLAFGFVDERALNGLLRTETGAAQLDNEFGGGGRELTAEDFDAASGVELSLSDPIERLPAGPRRAAVPEPQPPAGEPRGSVLVFGVVLTLVLVAASVGAIVYLDIELPWQKAEKVSATALPVKSFTLEDADTAAFYIDYERGVVLAGEPAAVPAEGRCAFVLESRSEPSPPGIFYFADVLDIPEGPITARPLERDELVERAGLCADAGTAAWDVTQSAEILIAEIRIEQLEKQRDTRVRSKKTAARAQKRAARSERTKSQKEKLIKMLIQKGTGIPLDLLAP